MEFIDFNQNLKRPDGYEISTVTAEGEYLVTVFTRWTGHLRQEVVVYLNSTGREVGRTLTSEDFSYLFPVLESAPEPPPLTRWQKIKEMFKCQNK